MVLQLPVQMGGRHFQEGQDPQKGIGFDTLYSKMPTFSCLGVELWLNSTKFQCANYWFLNYEDINTWNTAKCCTKTFLLQAQTYKFWHENKYFLYYTLIAIFSKKIAFIPQFTVLPEFHLILFDYIMHCNLMHCFICLLHTGLTVMPLVFLNRVIAEDH